MYQKIFMRVSIQNICIVFHKKHALVYLNDICYISSRLVQHKYFKIRFKKFPPIGHNVLENSCCVSADIPTYTTFNTARNSTETREECLSEILLN